jgi:hypothetical protein
LPRKWLLALAIALLIQSFAAQPVESDDEWPDESSKLGVHGILPDGILAYVESALEDGTPLTVVKAVDDLSYLIEVEELRPETITVARLTSEYEGASRANDPEADLEAYAGEIMRVIFDKLEKQPELAGAVDYWEPINEPLGGGVSTAAYERLAKLMIHCMDLAEQRGLRLALFSFSAGTPEWDDMTAIVDTGVFARAKAGGHILALHEGVYGDVPITQWYGPEHTIPGAPSIPDTGSLTGRYRYWYYLLQQRDQVIPLFISEFYAGGGYADSARVNDVKKRFEWYDRQLQRDDYVLGFAPFTLGPTSQWVDQDYAFFYQALFGEELRPEDIPIIPYLPIFVKRILRGSRHHLFLPLITK